MWNKMDSMALYSKANKTLKLFEDVVPLISVETSETFPALRLFAPLLFVHKGTRIRKITSS